MVWYAHPALVFILLVAAPNIGGYLSNLHNNTGWNGVSNDKLYINPPNFSVVPSWVIVYSWMGFGSFIVWYKSGGFSGARFTITFYAFQLAVYWCWSMIFYEAKLIDETFPAVVMMWTLVLITMYLFELIDCFAGLLMLPHFVWFTIASFFNVFSSSMSVDSVKNAFNQGATQGIFG